MGIKDFIGNRITNFLYPYIQSNYDKRSDKFMKKGVERERYLLEEKYLWFLGNEDLLAEFYQTKNVRYSLIDVRDEYYYSKVGSDIRVVHSGLPSLISYSKARLLLTGGIEYMVEKNGKESEKDEELLEVICKDNKLNDIIKSSVLTESWGKRFAWKISYDKSVSAFPIIEKYTPLEYEANYKRGRLQSIIFKNTYEYEDACYELQEEYGKGYIDYYLYLVRETGNIPVSLDEIEETRGLARVDFKDKSLILAGEKCNDKSDYDGLISEFDALDEAWSQLMDEIRLGRSEVYVPEILLTNKTFNKFRKNFAELGNDMHENGTNKIEHIQPAIRSDEYKNTISVLTNNILTSVGLSPFTVGIQDGVGANASGENLTKREATSLRTRSDMIEAWEQFLEEMLYKLMYAYAVFNNKAISGIEIKVSFGDYISPERSEIIDQTKAMIDASIIDQEKALDEIYGDELSDEEKQRILANVGAMTEALQPEEDMDEEDE